jgi:hypothetical protein
VSGLRQQILAGRPVATGRLAIGAVAAGGLVGLAVAVAALPLLLVLGLAVAGVLLLLVRERTLWILALVAFAALPLAYLPVPDLLLTLSPPALVLLVLLLRALVIGRVRPSVS